MHDTTTAASSNDDLKDRVRRRYKQLEFELGLESDSCDEDDVSLFEWDDSLLDGITTLSSNNHTIESPLPTVTEIPSPLIESVTPLSPPLIESVTPLPPLLIESVTPLPPPLIESVTPLPSPSPATLEHHEENTLELVYVSRVSTII